MDGILGTHKFDVLGRFATPASHDESEQHPEGGIQSTEQHPNDHAEPSKRSGPKFLSLTGPAEIH